MNTLIKMVTLLIVINIFMYMAVNFSITAEGKDALNKDYNFYFENDLISQYMGGYNNVNKLTEDAKTNWTSYGLKFSDAYNAVPSQAGGISTGAGGISFLDNLKIAWDFILTLFNLITAPLTLFFNFRMPVFVGLMIGVPYFLILLFCVFAMIRGVGD